MLLLLQIALTNFKFCGIINKKKGYSIMIDNTEEKFLYELMSKLYSMNVPIVFKGAMVLKAVQSTYGNPSGLVRETHDLDGDWVGRTPSMQMLQEILQSAVNQLGYPLLVEAYRDYGKDKSAGFRFKRQDGVTFTKMDLGIRPNSSQFLYSFVNGITFVGQSVDKIVVDKILVCSTKSVFRRIKDVIDLYILSYCWKGSIQGVYNMMAYYRKSLGDFSQFLNHYTDLEHAYGRYSNTASVLPFKTVYDRVAVFLYVFTPSANVQNKCNLVWNGERWVP